MNSVGTQDKTRSDCHRCRHYEWSQGTSYCLRYGIFEYKQNVEPISGACFVPAEEEGDRND